MYTRCPSCRAEIKFDAPQNLEALPEGYKHRIKCPSCGVTIAVHLDQPVTTVSTPTYEVKPGADTEVQLEVTDKPVEKAATKKPGTLRNLIIFFISLAFVALHVVGYLVEKGTIKTSAAWLQTSIYFSGITGFEFLIKGFDSFKAMFNEDAVAMIVTYVIPMFVFVIAGVNVIVALISAFGGKYGRAYNVVSGVIVGGGGILTMFLPYLVPYLMYDVKSPIVDYLKSLVDGTAGALILAAAALGLVMIILVLIFIKSLENKPVVVKSEETATDAAE